MSILSNLMGWLGKSSPLGEDERHAIGQVVTVADPMLKTVSGYERRLSPAVRRALVYCEGLVAMIPGPVELTARSFVSDPLIHALFATAGDIGVTLGKSRAVKIYLADPASITAEHFYALLGMRRHEKKVMGMALHGEMVCADSPQTMLYFADHTLHTLSHGLDETRRRLSQAAFDSLVLGFAAQLADMRRERQALHDAWDMQRAMSARDGNAVSSASGNPHTQRREKLEEQMRMASAELSPERVLDALCGWLAAPETHLRLEPTTVSVDRMGVMVDDASTDPQVSTLNLPELIGRDRRHWIILIARISRDEAVRALEQQHEASRYLII
ncbi:MAG: hypothetical protein PHQ05_11300 [Sterolibacterium sp.]|nr:hypothetical protein [Sterolibacterium sp.]